MIMIIINFILEYIEYISLKEMVSNSSSTYRHCISSNLKSAIHGYFTEYETPKFVLIHSFKFALLLRIMQIIILIYSILYLLLYEKGYQKQDTTIISSVTLKAKGIGYVNITQNKSIVIDVAGIFKKECLFNRIILLFK
jgi:hypothetical protein